MLMIFGILGGAIVLFAWGRPRVDIVAILVVLALMLSRVLTPHEALAGFGDPVVVLIAAIFIVGEARARLTMAEDAAERQAELVKQNATAKQLARSSQIEVEIARAIVARNESALAKAQLALSRTRVAAPLSGTVGRPRVAPGAFVEATAGTRSLRTT
jgi:multidrug efflux pump subunit AcrA (membrane-fusion protein)